MFDLRSCFSICYKKIINPPKTPPVEHWFKFDHSFIVVVCLNKTSLSVRQLGPPNPFLTPIAYFIMYNTEICQWMCVGEKRWTCYGVINHFAGLLEELNKELYTPFYIAYHHQRHIESSLCKRISQKVTRLTQVRSVVIVIVWGIFIQ